MNEGAVEAKLDAIKADISRIDGNVARIFHRMDEQADLAHEVRIKSLESRMEGFWARVTALVAAIVGLFTGIAAWWKHS